MTGVSQIFDRALLEVFDRLAQPVVTRFAGAGAVRLQLSFTSKVLADEYLSSFRTTPEHVGEVASGRVLSLGVVTVSDIDLSYVIPQPANETRTYIDSSYFVAWSAGVRPILYVLDRMARRGFVWLASGTAPEWELSRPACPLVHAVMMDTPWAVVHGGAVGRGERFLMLAGKGRVGKSTAALACARAGWSYAGDDYIMVDTATGRIEPLYISARLRADMAHAFPDLMPLRQCLSDDDGEIRHELRLVPHLEEGLVRGGSLAAILLPRRVGSPRPVFEPAGRTEVFDALFVQTHLGLPGPLRGIAKKLMALVALAPAFFVDTGPVPEAIPEAFENFLNAIDR